MATESISGGTLGGEPLLNVLEGRLDIDLGLSLDAVLGAGVCVEGARAEEAGEGLCVDGTGEVVHPFVEADGFLGAVAGVVLFGDELGDGGDDGGGFGDDFAVKNEGGDLAMGSVGDYDGMKGLIYLAFGVDVLDVFSTSGGVADVGDDGLELQARVFEQKLACIAARAGSGVELY